MNDANLDELTQRLPTSELVKIIKAALAHGRQAQPFTESELFRALTFGAQSTFAPRVGSAQRPDSSQSGTHRVQRRVPVRRSAHPPPAVASLVSPSSLHEKARIRRSA